MRPFPSLALACLCLAAPVVALPPASSADDDRPAHANPAAGMPDGTVLGTDRPQTSDGVVGEVAADVPRLLRGHRTTANLKRWRVRPGVAVTTWNERDARGPVRFSMITVSWNARGVGLDYANAGPVRRTAPVRAIVSRAGAVAGVNGDFFDIGDTGAPLGIGRDREHGLLHGRRAGWNSAFYVSRHGVPRIGVLETHARVRNRPGLRITNVNSPEVAVGGIGVYTSRWGHTAGYRVTGGQRHDVRMVVVREGRVVRNTHRLASGTPVRGTVLVGRGPGARQLYGLKRGTRVRVSTWLDGRPRLAITGNTFLVRDGLVTVVDDREMHPRTAIGIDRDSRTLILLTVDGRRATSRGYTMVELAEKMIDLGAEAALNLDGGGSTTMLAGRPGQRPGLVNSPSDGVERRVANAVVVTYRPPR
ncbi:hypothetical protein GCM10023340_16100 [Nocardioides marinquilinus]|uniref:Phosphodiester glycosidase domain-containing protein n=1 Tax=Nocardioides marinquilinus TaxID=1210400 RepID=A0ABP9PFZ0_9ACTN